MQARHSILRTDQRFAMPTLETDIIFGARLARERLSGHERAEVTRYVQSERRTRTAMGGALSSLGRVLVLKGPNDSMVAWEWIDTGMIGGLKTEKIVI